MNFYKRLTTVEYIIADDLELIIEKNQVYENQIDIQLKSDIDNLLHAAYCQTNRRMPKILRLASQTIFISSLSNPRRIIWIKYH